MLCKFSKTRWAAKSESMQAVWRSLEAIHEALVSLEYVFETPGNENEGVWCP